jgi:hypothetical protein
VSTNRATDHLAFGLPINKDVVRRILAARYQPKPDSAGPSWLTRRECLDRTLFWTAVDLEVKLLDFQRYFQRSSRARARKAHRRVSVGIVHSGSTSVRII